jgi:hypothetical protein
MRKDVVIACLFGLLVGLLFGVIASGQWAYAGGVAATEKSHIGHCVSTNEDGNILYEWNTVDNELTIYSAVTREHEKFELKKSE